MMRMKDDGLRATVAPSRDELTRRHPPRRPVPLVETSLSAAPAIRKTSRSSSALSLSLSLSLSVAVVVSAPDPPTRLLRIWLCQPRTHAAVVSNLAGSAIANTMRSPAHHSFAHARQSSAAPRSSKEGSLTPVPPFRFFPSLLPSPALKGSGALASQANPKKERGATTENTTAFFEQNALPTTVRVPCRRAKLLPTLVRQLRGRR
ncbi:hypothetical protein B0J12DRAFT_207525 [Macrophomina phaseolina]|uniref:Uncharacterized protein n=1 Tax=Macrophomina phaseolina TaxID=35725 RepID=A0ABQ8G2D7_9PEZI|nr:hypothetical protein B0J12DRAFT_207525 [Macrophomina phaseolina]